MQKLKERDIAIGLRKKGFTYSEILKRVRVAKSTLSSWFYGVQLSKRQKQKITSKRIVGRLRALESIRRKRVENTEKIIKFSSNQIGKLSRRDLWLIGTALYWAEGSKQRVGSVSQGVVFANSDPSMIRIFLKFLSRILEIRKDDLIFEIYIHSSHNGRIEDVREFWSRQTGFPTSHFDRIYFKNNKIVRRRIGLDEDYFGLLRVKVKSSSALNRQISGWVKGISN